MDRYILILPIKFGVRVYFHDNGVIREAEYIGMKAVLSNICGQGVMEKYIFWCGKKSGFKTLEGVRVLVYRTIDDAYMESNPIPMQKVNMEDFSRTYITHLNWDGFSFSGWKWNGSKPICCCPRNFYGKMIGIYIEKDKSPMAVLRDGDTIPFDYFDKFYQTANECRKQHSPVIETIEDEDNKYLEEQKRKEFYDYVVCYCPGLADQIDWELFDSEGSIFWNLAKQAQKHNR